VPKEGGVLQKMRKDDNGNIKLRLGKKIKITSDTYIFRFSFVDPDHSFGLPIGQHVIFSATIPTKEHPEGELVQRKYTPISTVQNCGYVDFVIKIYRKNVHPKFPDGGVMTQFLENLEAGNEMLMEGPKGRLVYQGFGNFQIGLGKQIQLVKKNIGLIAGGTGITPCYQVLQAALDGDDGTNVSLVFGNRSVEDILLKDELDQFKTNYPERFKLFYTVDVQP
jgi:NAD(P)H-flavin reductase